MIHIYIYLINPLHSFNVFIVCIVCTCSHALSVVGGMSEWGVVVVVGGWWGVGGGGRG